MATALLARLPLELWDYIIREHLGAPMGEELEDRETLANFSVASGSHVILEMCQKVLFSRADISRPVQVDRLLEVYAKHEELIPHLTTLCIMPERPYKYDESDDDSGDEYEEEDEDASDSDEEGDKDEGNETDEDLPQWEEDQSTFEHASVLALLSFLSSQTSPPTNIRNIALCGTGNVPEAQHEQWTYASLDVWARFLALPSIKHLFLFYVAWPCHLLGRSPNLEELFMHHTCLTSSTSEWWSESRQAFTEDPFPKLKHLTILQTDVMGVGFSDMVRHKYVMKEIKSKALESFRLESDGDNDDRWAWMETLEFVSYFGSDTITTLELWLPLGYYPQRSFCQHWIESGDEVSGFVAQLNVLRNLKFVFHIQHDRYFPLTGRDLGATAFEPYVPVVMEGISRTRPPLHTLNIVLRGTASHMFKFQDKEKTELSNDAKELLDSFLSAPIWGKLDGWMGDNFAQAKLRLELDSYKSQTPKDFLGLVKQPLLGRMPRLKGAGAVEIVLDVLPYG